MDSSDGRKLHTGGPHSSRGKSGRGRGHNHGKKRDLGRAEWAKQKVDKRQRNDNEQAAKRQKLESGDANPLPIYATKFDEEELKNEERRPKKKVAVMIGYAGTGYRGMQMTHDQKTIEGDLFQAFVKAGAISKANADDPKKSSFVRCARTDKGVHAAGNVISLKLIVEEPDIVEKINKELVPQIRIWGFERTNNSFSAYQLVDSRVYEYLLPSSSLLPPHPDSFLGRKCREWAERKNNVEQWHERQQDVKGFWEKIDEVEIRPILEEYGEETRKILEKALYMRNDEENEPQSLARATEGDENHVKHVNRGAEQRSGAPESTLDTEAKLDEENGDNQKQKRWSGFPEAIKRLRAVYTKAKRAYRVSEARLTRLREALAMYVGTRNYHNYTVEKTYKDPSAKRVIKSFVVNPKPILIDGTEWLSLKVHGQSFMMHQIRKMVGMASLVVRCGSDASIMFDSYGEDRLSIPKAPALGLLLERPVFDTYNQRAKNQLSKEPIDFDKYKTEMNEFKQVQIYERMYRDEEKENVFGNFYNHIDNFPSEAFLFVTSGGVEATKEKIEPQPKVKEEKHELVEADVEGSDDEDLPAHDALGDEG